MLVGVYGDCYRILLVDTILVLSGQWFPGGLPCLPSNKNVVSRTPVFLVIGLDNLVIEYFLEFPYSVPGIILFDVVDNVVVCDNVFVLAVDKTFETGEFSGR